jgi:hypothetical protein
MGEDEELQQKTVIDALWSLAKDENLLKAIVKRGAVEVLVRAMETRVKADAKKGKTKSACAEFGMGVLVELVSQKHDWSKAGVVPMLLRALSQYMEDEAVVQYALEFLSALPKSQMNSSDADGLMKRTVDAVHAHTTSPAVLELGLECLYDFARVPDNHSMLMLLHVDKCAQWSGVHNELKELAGKIRTCMMRA